MLLLINALAVVIFRAIEIALFLLGQMAVVLGLIHRFAAGDIGIVRFVARGLLLRHGAVLQTVLDAILLVFQAIVHFVDAWMVGHIGLRKYATRRHRCTDDQTDDDELRLCVHGGSLDSWRTS